MSSSSDLVAAVNFAAANPVVAGRMYNAAGSASGAIQFPLQTGVGVFRFFINGEVARTAVEVNCNANNAAGALRFVSAVFSAPAGGQTIVDLHIRDAADAVTNDATNVQCTIRRLPLMTGA